MATHNISLLTLDEDGPWWDDDDPKELPSSHRTHVVEYTLTYMPALYNDLQIELDIACFPRVYRELDTLSLYV